ncbi:hypothetical protein BH09PLA1_BH09PLA1_04410 [soil metagenome]
MELKGVKPGTFHPRCVGCKEKFLLQIFADPGRAPVVAAEHDAKAETISPVVAHALGVDDVKTRPPSDSASVSEAPASAAPVRLAPRRVAPSNVQTAAPAPAPVAARRQSHEVRETSVAINAGNEHSKIVDGTGEINDDLDSQIVGATLGGYHISQKIGAGGMGAVYLARQISLDRNVALKVLAPTLANDPQFVARFTREAYAAAQLSHHNVVQIHDIGAESDLHFFSMEFVEGRTLAKMVDEHGKVDAEQAVGLVLQAARGLKYAHDHGLIHRDIKPENLMLNDSGIVKVADLGLVKRRGFNETAITGVRGGAGADSPDQTQANMSMGTPAYMSPEQATDAAKVDQRADIYSLGCTMYDLLTGRPPFVGRTAMEVITKHQREAVVPPDMVVKNVPRTLSEILLKMIAKQPLDRYQTMSDVIKALEDFLGVAQTGPFTPTEEHTKVLEFAVERFNGSKWATIRKVIFAVFLLVCAALAVLVGMTRSVPNDAAAEILSKIRWTGAFVGLAVLSALSYFIVTGITQRTHLFMKFRQLVFGSSLGDWILWALVLIGVMAILIVFSQLLPWLIVAGIAVFLACAFHWTIDLALSRDRQKPIAQTEAMLKTMRLRGLDENSLRQFVCRYAGKRWEEFYEAMFGYEAKLKARRLWGPTERGRERPKFAAWRDPIISGIEARISMRRELRERRLLARVEAKALRAKGIREDLARQQANKNARALVERAEKIRRTSSMRAAKTIGPTTVAGRAGAPETQIVNRDVLLEGAIAAILRGGSMAEAGITQGKHAGDDDDEHDRRHESWFKRRYGTPIDLICSPMIRVVLAIIVLTTFTLWFKQNSGDQAAREAAEVMNRRREIDVSGQLTDIKGQIVDLSSDADKARQRLVDRTGNKSVQLFPESFETLNHYATPFGGWNAGLAGLLLLLSAFFMGRVMALIVVLAAAVAMIGHRLGVELPWIGTIAPWMSAAAATLLWIFGVMFFRDREGY